jgi:adenylosuccinate lyase
MTEYAEQYDLITYLQTSQYPQRFESAAAWTSEWAHFGSISISVLEASHGQLKRYLENSRGDLLNVVEKIKLRADKQIRDHRQSYARVQVAIPSTSTPSTSLISRMI